MAVDALRHTAVTRLRVRVSSPTILTLVVLTSFSIRVAGAMQRATPLYFPDEYLYNQLGRTIASSGTVAILGSPIAFPAILEPLLQSLSWLPGDPELAYRLTQSMHAILMSLAAVPAYLIARTLGLRSATAVVCATAVVVSPDLVYSSFATADALGYVLAMMAIWLGVRVLVRPDFGAQAMFVAVATLATLARLQYATLVPAVLAAAVVVERGRIAGVARQFWLIAGAVALGLLGGVAIGTRVLGGYAWLATLAPETRMLTWLGSSAYLLALACGAVVVPGAVAWIATQMVRPRSRDAAAFASLATFVLLSLLCMSAVISVSTTSDRFFERYLMIGLPLMVIAFAAWLRDRCPGEWAAVGTAAALAAVVALRPISEFSGGGGAADSPFLLALARLERIVGIGNAGVIVAIAATAALAVGLLGLTGWHGAATAGFTMTLLALGAASIGVHVEDVSVSRKALDARFGSNPPSWVDQTGVRDVLLVQTPGGDRVAAMGHVFWNESITTATTLGAETLPIDGTGQPITVTPSGAALLHGKRVRRPLLVQTRGSRPILVGARVLGRAPGLSLVAPGSTARFAALVTGLGSDGWLESAGAITVFAPARGCRRLVLELENPMSSGARKFVLVGGGRPETLSVPSGTKASLSIEATPGRATEMRYHGEVTKLIAGRSTIRAVSFRADALVQSCAAQQNR